jgi:hypothetical protein
MLRWGAAEIKLRTAHSKKDREAQTLGLLLEARSMELPIQPRIAPLLPQAGKSFWCRNRFTCNAIPYPIPLTRTVATPLSQLA